MEQAHGGYYIPTQARWPIVGSVALTTMVLGGVNWLHDHSIGKLVLLAGLALLIVMVFGWFSDVIRENQTGQNNEQVDRSYRWGMAWFIVSEVSFFAAFFGTLLWARQFSVPWLGGEGDVMKALSHSFLWPNFEASWPLLHPPKAEGFDIPTGVVPAWGVPAINTAILLSSGVTITIAHWGLLKNNRVQLVLGMWATVLLGAAFLYLQVDEYAHAMHELNLTLASGIYGSTFYMLTGFHGAHVTLGTIMLIVITLRCMKGHFTKEHHFGFEAVAWYWHFVDVVWLGLFVFVYWL
jgi:cytochrome c oxidase subunit III